MMKSDNEILDISFQFSRLIIRTCGFLQEKKEFILSKQLLRAGTSIGANIHEAQAAQSSKDFLSKLSIASKEARETEYWIKLLDVEGYFNGFGEADDLRSMIQSIVKLLTAIVKTTKSKIENQ